MKWIGQNIQDFISRFRNYVYIEKADTSISTKALVIDEHGKIGTNSAFTVSGVTSVTVGPAALSSGAVTTITPNVGSVIVTPNAYAGTTNVGHVPAGGGATTFLRGDATWVTPTDTTYAMMTDVVLGLGKLENNTTQAVAANPASATASRTYGVQKNASDQLVVNVPWTTPISGVTSFTNIAGIFVANAVTNAGATGAVSLGRVDLTATGIPGATNFLCGDNTWKIPIMPTHVTSFTNVNGTFVSAGTVNTGASGTVTTGIIDLSATGTPSGTTFLRGDNTWAVPSYATGTVTAVTGTLPIVSSGGTTPAISINAATDTTTGAVELATSAETIAGASAILSTTPAGVKAAIDARYTYSYFAYSFRCATTTDEEWYFPSDNGITKYEWSNRDAGSAVPGSIALTDTLTIDRYSFQAGIFIPQACVFAGFYGTVRMSNNLPNTTHPVIAIFYNAPIPDGSTASITPGCIAFDTTAGSGNRLNRMNVIESNQEAALAAGSVIFPAFGPDVALTSTGTTIGQITLKFKTLIP